MIKNEKIEYIVCDNCGLKLKEQRDFYINDGSFQQDFIKIKDNDLCLSCASKLLKEVFSSLNLTDDELNIEIFNIRKNKIINSQNLYTFNLLEKNNYFIIAKPNK